MTKPKGPRPLFLTRDHIVKYYGVDTGTAERITQHLEPVGWYTGSPLYAQQEVDKEIRKNK